MWCCHSMVSPTQEQTWGVLPKSSLANYSRKLPFQASYVEINLKWIGYMHLCVRHVSGQIGYFPVNVSRMSLKNNNSGGGCFGQCCQVQEFPVELGYFYIVVVGCFFNLQVKAPPPPDCDCNRGKIGGKKWDWGSFGQSKCSLTP